VDNQGLTLLNRIKDSDIYFSFIKSPTAIASTIILLIIFFCSFFVEVVAGILQQVCGWIDINHSCGSAKLKSY